MLLIIFTFGTCAIPCFLKLLVFCSLRTRFVIKVFGFWTSSQKQQVLFQGPYILLSLVLFVIVFVLCISLLQLVFKVCIYVVLSQHCPRLGGFGYSQTCLTLPQTLSASPKPGTCNPVDVRVLCYVLLVWICLLIWPLVVIRVFEYHCILYLGPFTACCWMWACVHYWRPEGNL